MRLPVDMTGMSSTSAQVFVAGPRDLRTRRPARTYVGLIMMSLMLTLAIQRVVIAAPRDTSGHGALVVQGVDRNGRVSSSARIIDISGALPGMQPQTSSFEVRNTGTVPVAFAVDTKGQIANGPHSLDNVLRIAVRDRSGALVYQGRISGLRIEHTGPLAAGSAARFTVQTTWPSTPADAAYEGAGMGFTVVASPFSG
jgi:hypothetical protein